MSSTKDSLLQLIVQFCRNETAKPKASEGNLNHLRLALHIVSNCCCCHEGRTIINKVSETMVASVARLRTVSPKGCENKSADAFALYFRRVYCRH